MKRNLISSKTALPILLFLLVASLLSQRHTDVKECRLGDPSTPRGSKVPRDLQLQIRCEKDTYAIGEPIAIELRFYNTQRGGGQSASDPKVWVGSNQTICTGFRISSASGKEEIAGFVESYMINMPWPPAKHDRDLIALHPGHFWGCSFHLTPGPHISIGDKEGKGRIFHVRGIGTSVAVDLIQKPGKYSITSIRDLVETIRFTGESAPRKLVSERIESNTISITVVPESKQP